jgi:hypothetical protein
VRTHLKLSIATLATAVAVTACGDARATEANEDLKRDLALASSTVNLAGPRVDSALLNSMETKPQGAPEAAPVIRKGPGPRAIRSSTPTVAAEPTVEVAAEETIEEVTETLQDAPAPEISEPVAVAPRPQPVVVQTGGTGDYGTGSGGIYGGGGGSGVIIRGGGIDGDNCEAHRRGGRGTIFVPQQPTYPNTGGVVVSRAPRGTSSGIGSRGPGVSRSSAPSRSESSSRQATFRTARGVVSRRGR